MIFLKKGAIQSKFIITYFQIAYSPMRHVQALDFGSLKLCMLCNVGLFYLSFPSREDGIPWNSNIIVERVSNNAVKTVSGRVYILVGKMNKSYDTGKPDSVVFSTENNVSLWQKK